jgi:beta-glucanase (GH16 family)
MHKREIRTLVVTSALTATIGLGAWFVHAQTVVTPDQRPTNIITPPPAVLGTDWHLAFHDEFDEETLDTGKWTRCDTGIMLADGCNSGNTGQLSYQVPDEAYVEDGVLRLRAQQRVYTDSAGVVHEYTSGMISSRDRYQFLYGYLEFRARIPAGRGMWTGLYTLPSRDRWQPPEIDLVETLGNDPTRAFLTHHFDNRLPTENVWQVQGEHQLQTGFHTAYHTYAVDWQPGLVVWYVDGVERFRTTQRIQVDPAKILAKFTVGVNWNDNNFVDTTTVFPSYLDIDYIRLWKRGPEPAAITEPFTTTYNLAWGSPNLTINTDVATMMRGDTGRLTRTNNQTATALLNLEGMSVVTATVYYWPGEPIRHVQFAASEYNVAFVTPTVQIDDRGGDWRQVNYTVTLPANTNWLRMTIPETQNNFTIQVGEVSVRRPAGPIVTPTARPTRTPGPSATPPPALWSDELNSVANMAGRTSRLRMESVFPERFEGDPSRLIRWSLDPEWAMWRVRGGATFTVTSYYWLGDPIKPLSILTSTDGISFTLTTPQSVTTQLSDPQWVRIDYSVPLAANVTHARAVFPKTNYNHSPQISRVVANSGQTLIPPPITATPTAAATATATPAAVPTATPTTGATAPAVGNKVFAPTVSR